MSEAAFYNALNLLRFGDPIAMRKNSENYDSWKTAWQALGKNSPIDPEKEWAKLEEAGVKLLFPDDENFPEPLKEIPGAPLALYYKGNFFDENPRVAVVGTRKATFVGREAAKKFASELAGRGITIISGLAIGIDTAAHEGALAAGGKTIAVLANGLDWVYPRQNERLAGRILENGGALVSEYPLGSESLPHRFLERNRIISGLSSGAVVIEAPDGSGSLATANCALEQNREVFVVPGPIGSENYHGSHSLLRAGARLVADPLDVLEDLNLQGLIGKQIKSRGTPLLEEKQELIVGLLKEAGQPLTVDKIHEITKIEIPLIGRSLTFLLIKGLIKEEGGRYFV